KVPRNSYPWCSSSVRPASPERVYLVQLEVDGEVEDDVDGLAVERAGLESPLPDRVSCRLVETESERLEHGHVGDLAVFVDDALDDDDAGDARLAGDFRIGRLDTADDHRRFDVAADAHRRFDFRRRRSGIGHDAADDSTDDTADDATF